MSLLQDIIAIYDRLEELNPCVNVRGLRDEYLSTHTMDFKGDIAYSCEDWNKFLIWVKETYGIEIQCVSEQDKVEEWFPF